MKRRRKKSAPPLKKRRKKPAPPPKKRRRKPAPPPPKKRKKAGARIPGFSRAIAQAVVEARTVLRARAAPERPRKRKPTRLEVLREQRPTVVKKKPTRYKEVEVQSFAPGTFTREFEVGHSHLARHSPDHLRDTFAKVVTSYAAKGPLEVDDVTFRSVAVGFRVVGQLEGSGALAEIVEFLRTAAPSLEVAILREGGNVQTLRLTSRKTMGFAEARGRVGATIQKVASYAWEVLDAYFSDAAWWVEWESDEEMY